MIKDTVLLISVTIPDLNTNIDDMIRRKEVLQAMFKSIGLNTENVDAKQLLKFISYSTAYRLLSSRRFCI
ncbi:F pilus assembly Type-IV secretion system for plasmid transfer family protein [Orientia chuto str. Dubai]|uniref:F pilus assembly Type-IV secretion system for plasmid transfer family protein n=1 Tax=Orientia chuto str. Dubai TaxID=1359168 RepID=A0A0F3MGR7_9RICK|nr:hypothetical protein [Candidatus Orientia mediorientalis]KJV54856.1 F pilus assembly Type-IV secretion system for plasmid transfer family protein [Orientia chuto str. Dubai]